jgi:hypothetical protein
MTQNSVINFNDLVFNHGNFLDMKVFEKKINEEDMAFGILGNSSTLKKYSFTDIIKNNIIDVIQ